MNPKNGFKPMEPSAPNVAEQLSALNKTSQALNQRFGDVIRLGAVLNRLEEGQRAQTAGNEELGKALTEMTQEVRRLQQDVGTLTGSLRGLGTRLSSVETAQGNLIELLEKVGQNISAERKFAAERDKGNFYNWLILMISVAVIGFSVVHRLENHLNVLEVKIQALAPAPSPSDVPDSLHQEPAKPKTGAKPTSKKSR